MAWTLLAAGSLEEFQAAIPPVNQLPKGTRMRLELTTSLPIAPLFDLWGAEWVVSKMLNEGGAYIVDVEGIGWYTIVVHMVADPVWVWVVIGVIVAICSYFGWLLFRELRLFAEAVAPIAWGFIGLIAAAITIPIVIGLIKRKERG